MSSPPYRRRFTPGALDLPPAGDLSTSGIATPVRAVRHASRRVPHVAFVNVAAASHVYPSLPLVRELVRRGVRVTYAVGGQLGEIVSATGARLLACTSVLPAGGVGRWPADLIESTNLFLDEAEHALPQIRSALDEDRPDLVLFDSAALAGWVAASGWGIPAVEVSVSLVSSGLPDVDLDAMVAAMQALPGGRRASSASWTSSLVRGSGWTWRGWWQGPNRR